MYAFKRDAVRTKNVYTNIDIHIRKKINRIYYSTNQITFSFLLGHFVSCFNLSKIN